MLWCHSNTRVNSHQRWKQTRNRVCFHLWCELTSTMSTTELCGITASLSVFLETNKHQNLTRLRALFSQVLCSCFAPTSLEEVHVQRCCQKLTKQKMAKSRDLVMAHKWGHLLPAQQLHICYHNGHYNGQGNTWKILPLAVTEWVSFATNGKVDLLMNNLIYFEQLLVVS